MFPYDKLIDADIIALKPKPKDYKQFIGGGLYILVAKNGSKLWRLKYRFDGKERSYSIGVYPKISINEALRAREDVKALIKQGINPVSHRKHLIEERIAKNKTEKVFELALHENGGITIKKDNTIFPLTSDEVLAVYKFLSLSAVTRNNGEIK